MEYKRKRLTQGGLLVVLIALCSVAFRMASAQKTDPPGGIPEGYALIDGDMMLPISVVESLRRQKTLWPDITPQATYRTNLWTNGIIPFEFELTCQATSTCAGAQPSGCVSAAKQTAMNNAIAVLEAVANVDFQQCPNNTCGGNHVRIRDSTNDTTVGMNNACVVDSRNSSQVGMVGGEQLFNIVSWGTQFIIVHELLHCLGFFHEHTRPDRNTFIQINCNNLQGGCGGAIFNDNFVVPNDASAYGYYDFESLMHYSQCSFSTDCPAGADCACTNTVITVLAPNQVQQTLIGQRVRLSDLDQATVSFLYPFGDWRFLDCTYNGVNGASDGTFRRPYTTFNAAIANTPAGGTLWALNSCTYTAPGTYSNQITIRSAPRVTATIGG